MPEHDQRAGAPPQDALEAVAQRRAGGHEGQIGAQGIAAHAATHETGTGGGGGSRTLRRSVDAWSWRRAGGGFGTIAVERHLDILRTAIQGNEPWLDECSVA
ncbi:hypothetical protein Abr02nite_64900 [Paractinoplanes brasiliensis]|nr:hypothetical protein Abr02nite_64900 [Actinoplanes brasiliensis]